jgi:hypothetical protein
MGEAELPFKEIDDIPKLEQCDQCDTRFNARNGVREGANGMFCSQKCFDTYRDSF